MIAWSIVAVALAAWVCAFGVGLIVAGFRYGFRWWEPPKMARKVTSPIVRSRATAATAAGTNPPPVAR